MLRLFNLLHFKIDQFSNAVWKTGWGGGGTHPDMQEISSTALLFGST